MGEFIDIRMAVEGEGMPKEESLENRSQMKNPISNKTKPFHKCPRMFSIGNLELLLLHEVG